MGRRTINTTKGGKFMNPTDQARKEARRRELKKNKRQRMAVRQAVIRTKDPQVMIKDLEELDEMELNPVVNSPYNEKVVKEKRRKLLESLIRIVDYYCKEDPSRGREFRVMIEEYKSKRLQKESFSESVRNAQTVDIGAIPLPDAPFETPDLSDIPLPGVMPQSILKKPPGPPAGLPPSYSQIPHAPGHPPGIPPSKKVFISRDSPEFAKLIATEPIEEEKRTDDNIPYSPEDGIDMDDQEEGNKSPTTGANKLDDDEDDDDEFHHRDDEDLDDFDNTDDEEESLKRRGVHFADDGEGDSAGPSGRGSSNVTPLQAMMLKMAGQKIPKVPASGIPHEDQAPTEAGGSSQHPSAPKPRHMEPPGPPPGLPPGPPPGMPPMMKPGILPPGPPPGLPPGPPPGMPGSAMGPPLMMKASLGDGQQQASNIQQAGGMKPPSNPNVFSAPPSIISRPATLNDASDDLKSASSATISAKPQLTATVPRGEATRFMPTSLRVRREVKPTNKSLSRLHQADSSNRKHMEDGKKSTTNKPSADDAYDSFMKEMKGLL